MTQALTNGEVLEALEVFEKCQTENLNFKLKYAIARNIGRLKFIKKAYLAAKDVSNDGNCKDFLVARKRTIENHRNGTTVDRDAALEALEGEHPEAVAYLAAKGKEVTDWLENKAEEFEIFKIPITSFPAETTIDIGKIFAFISDE